MNGDKNGDTASEYVSQTAALLGITLAAEHQPSVTASLILLRDIVQPLLDFPLPEDIESAPHFEP